MKMDESQQLLADYVKNGSESAFRGLVTRYINSVHSTALRLVNGDGHLAEDVTQTVFVDLARKARTLPPEMVLGGWLHRDTCFVAGTIMRGERRRHFRERQAVAMNIPEDHTAANLALVAPILDEAINQLEPDDRTAILLRFFEQLEFRAVGEAMGSNEDAARMRVNRALDKLHGLLKNRGVAFSAAALGTALAAGFVSAAPLGLAATVAGTALAGVATGGVTASLLKFMTMIKFKIALVSAVAVAAVVTDVVQHQTIKGLHQETVALEQQVAQIAPLQEQLARAAQEAANAGGGALSQAQVRDLARLRNEVSQLRGQTNELAKARQEIQALNQRMAALGNRNRQSASSAADLGDLSGVFTNENKRVDLCIKNLRVIDSAKAQWALESGKQITDTPTMKDLLPYFGGPGEGLVVPICSDGGEYTLGSVGEKPTCSIPRHVLR
jgi:RNA polymerase sigma factor (sigma-70 family)